MNLRRMSTVGVIVLGVAALAGCSKSAQEFKAGQCLNGLLDASTQVESLPVVGCDKEHEGEVYAVKKSSLDSYNIIAVRDEADEYCLAEFETYVGTDYMESTLFFTHLTPSSQSWSAGDRDIVCIVMPAEDTVTGSLKGSNL